MKFKKIESMDISDHIPKSLNGTINPYHQDAYHMGVQIGNNVTILMENFDRQFCKYFIIVDTMTGEQVKVTLKEN